MKKLFILSLAMGLLALFTIPLIAIDAPDTVEIKHIQKLYTSVKFPHKKHATDLNITCVQCHHTYKPETDTSVKGCASEGCHQAQAAEGKTNLKDAYHKQCKDCHTKAKTEGKPFGPTTCHKGCHEKVEAEKK